MKDKQNKHLKIAAQKIMKAEKELLLGKNIKENQQKIEDIMSSLSVEDMLQIDEYITKKKLLTK